MGAWGLGPFDNDDALDFIGDLVEADDDSMLADALATASVDEDEYIEAPDGCNAIAAAEVVAAANGKPVKKLPDAARKWLKGKPKPDAKLLGQARKAMKRILGKESELQQLWEESDNLDAWKDVVEELIQRLS
ncbi:MAG: DUF4259 domain-containing protein [Planctomycetota bacterium]|nr:DUF4259 domain-containing protein [Planctomycetota bacterium]